MQSGVRLGKLLLVACLALGSLVARNALASDPAFVYVNANPDNQPNSVAGFLIGADGLATPIAGAPFATGGVGLTPVSGAEFAHRLAVVSPRGLLFAANDGSSTISVFNVNASGGALHAVSGSPFRLGAGATFSGISLAASSDGRFLYASGSVVVSFFIDANGGLNELGSEWAFSQRVSGIAVSDDNTRVFLSTSSGVTILHTGEGGLTADPPTFISIGSGATDLRINRNGSRLWVGTTNSGIQAYTFDSGNAVPVTGMPFFAGIPNVSGLASDANAQSLFAFSPTGPRLLGAHINASGSLVLGAGSPLSPAVAPTAGAVTPDGTRLVLADGVGQFDAWTTASDGSLAHVPGYPLLTGANPGFPSIVTFPKANAVPAASPTVALLFAALLLVFGVAAARSRVSLS